MPIAIHNEIEISVSARDLFNYVTQPWLWHEWHPGSKSAKAAHSFLATGDEFSEIIEIQSMISLFPKMTRNLEYTVTESVPFHTWEAEGKTRDGWVRLRYDFEEKGGVTFFTRCLDLDASGPIRVLLPLLKPKMEKLSMIALTNLKTIMQAKPGEP
jgi:hypothetical protein